MKLYVTQGHERGIGLEVFFKSGLLLGPSKLKNVILLAYQDSVIDTLTSLKLPFTLTDEHVQIGPAMFPVQWLHDTNHSQSFTALELGMKLAETGNILFTLPTSKDQFPGFAGHTEYFRHVYRRPDLGMFFSSPSLQVLLLTDHIPLSEVTKSLTAELIFSRVDEALRTFKKWDWLVEEIFVAGFNPHAGEGGMIGSEDDRVRQALDKLKRKHQFVMSGPFPGDTMLLEQRSPRDLLIYLFHDQGLGVFKGLQGFIGSNITLGLPYPRFSPDHGTSFKLFGKNEADYRGCAHALNEALWLAERLVHGKNSSHQSESSQSKKH